MRLGNTVMNRILDTVGGRRKGWMDIVCQPNGRLKGSAWSSKRGSIRWRNWYGRGDRIGCINRRWLWSRKISRLIRWRRYNRLRERIRLRCEIKLRGWMCMQIKIREVQGWCTTEIWGCKKFAFGNLKGNMCSWNVISLLIKNLLASISYSL